ncbi:MAG: aryl-sulfate sulfotransferase [Acidobacteriota bacterium]
MSKKLRRGAALLPVLGVVGMLGIGCAGPPTASDVALELNPNPAVPLAATLRLTTDRPATVRLAIDDGERVTEVAPKTDPVTEHEVLVLGLLPGTEHTVTATVVAENGAETALEPLTLETAPLPEDFPPIRVPVRKPQSMEAGTTMIQVFRWLPDEPGEDDQNWGLAFAADAEGRVRWFYRADFSFNEVRRLRSGNLFLADNGVMREIDMLGNIVASWHTRLSKPEERPEGSLPVDIDTFHHDVIEMPNGNFLALSTEARWFEDFPSEYPPSTATEPCHVIGDVVAEFTRKGEVVRQIKVLDVLDPFRIGNNSLSTSFYEDEYEDVLEKPGRDLTHSNALLYLPESDSVLVSSNHHGAHYQMSLATGELEWLAGDPEGWKEPWASKLLEPLGEVAWTYHQHGIDPTPRGTYLIYDNGGGRSIPPVEPMPVGERYSRVVEYRIDQEARTVEEVWEYGKEQEWFMSPFISDADPLLETGNVLITDGGRMVDNDGNHLDRFGGRNWGRVLEVTYGDDPEKVWELVIDDPSRGYSIYRSQRLVSLYPSLDRPTG